MGSTVNARFSGEQKLLGVEFAHSSEVDSDDQHETKRRRPRSQSFSSSVDQNEMFPLNTYQWSEQDVCTMLDAYLMEQISLLNDQRASRTTKEEVLLWILEPLETTPLDETSLLSFRRCCIAYGADPYEIQEGVMRRYAPGLLAEYGYE